MQSIRALGCRAVWVALAASLMACDPSPFTANWPAMRPLGRDFETYRPPTEPPPLSSEPEASADTTPLADQIEEPTGLLTLRQALALALMRNADLASFALEVRAAEARTLQASLLPNPQLDLEVENVAGSGEFHGANAAETTVTLSQLIELGGKRSRRTNVAALERDLAGWDYETVRIAVLTEVAQRFVDVLALQHRVELAEEAATLADQVYDTVAKRVEAGAASPVEKIRAGIIVSTTRIELQRVQRQLRAARYRLASTWSQTEPQFQAAAGQLELILPIPSAQSLTRLVSQNPQVARWAMEMAQRQAAVALAKSQGVPDVTVGAAVRRLSETDDTAGVFALSLPLPLFNRNQGGVLEARFNVAKARQQRRAAEVRVRTALAAVYHELAAAYSEAVALKTDVLPAARASFEAIQEAFRQGKLGYLDVLDAQRTLIDVQGRHIDALGAYHRAVAEAEGLIGQSLATVEPDASHDTEPSPEPGDQP